jgi:hypothetical protein
MMSQSRATAPPKLPTAMARARRFAGSLDAQSSVLPSPANAPSTVHRTCTVSPGVPGRASNRSSMGLSISTDSVLASGHPGDAGQPRRRHAHVPAVHRPPAAVAPRRRRRAA